MKLHYMDGGPFETTLYDGKTGGIVAYGDGTFLFVQETGVTAWGTAACFDPPPPIPAAARKPKVGEVWMLNGYVTLLSAQKRPASRERAAEFVLIDKHGLCVGFRCVPVGDDRPATPEEAEPFRPLLDGLMASLGEKA